jgi:hypothetical protein
MATPVALRLPLPTLLAYFDTVAPALGGVPLTTNHPLAPPPLSLPPPPPRVPPSPAYAPGGGSRVRGEGGGVRGGGGGGPLFLELFVETTPVRDCNSTGGAVHITLSCYLVVLGCSQPKNTIV